MTETEVFESSTPAATDRWRWIATAFAVVAVAALAFALVVLVRGDDSVARSGTMPMMSMDVDAMRDHCVAVHGDEDWCAEMARLMARHPGASTMPMMTTP